MVQNGVSKKDVLERADQLDFPTSVVEFFQGYLGQPVGGFPEPLRSKIIRNKPKIDGRPGAGLAPIEFKKVKAELRSKFGKHITDSDVTSYVMYPKVFEEYQGFVEKYGDLRYVVTTPREVLVCSECSFLLALFPLVISSAAPTSAGR